MQYESDDRLGAEVTLDAVVMMDESDGRLGAGVTPDAVVMLDDLDSRVMGGLENIVQSDFIKFQLKLLSAQFFSSTISYSSFIQANILWCNFLERCNEPVH